MDELLYPNQPRLDSAINQSQNLWKTTTIVLVISILILSSIIYLTRDFRLKSPALPIPSPDILLPNQSPPSITPTDWQTYEDRVNNFSLQYPSYATLQFDQQQNLVTITQPEPDYLNVNLTVASHQESSLDEYINSVRRISGGFAEINPPFGEQFKVITYQESNIGNKRAFRVIAHDLYKASRGFDDFFVELSPSQTLIISNLRRFADQSYQNTSLLFDQIIASLSFINETTSPSTSPQLGEAATQAECLQKGGTWGHWGLLGQIYCQIPAADAGKNCQDGSECSLGKCLTYDQTLPGTCQQFKNTFGCFSLVENGQLGPALCVD